MKKILLIAGAFIVLIYGATTLVKHRETVSLPVAQPSTLAKQNFNKSQHSTTDPASIWIVVNKQHPLSKQSYAPNDLVIPAVPLRVPGNESMQLRKATAGAVESLFAAARAASINLMVASGYRSYDYQVNLYGGYVSSIGQVNADKQSARPGYSEHQTGQAVDIEPTSKKCELEQCFGDTPEGIWVLANAYKYGFIVRYTATDVAITGYESEPWHYRYVGVELATEMHSTGVPTLEQYFGINGGTSY